jgi:hypothetical protein
MKISSLKNFKELGKHVIPQNLLHTIAGGTETSSSTSNSAEPTDPIPPATTDTTPPPPPPKETIYRIDGEFVYGM